MCDIYSCTWCGSFRIVPNSTYYTLKTNYTNNNIFKHTHTRINENRRIKKKRSKLVKCERSRFVVSMQRPTRANNFNILYAYNYLFTSHRTINALYSKEVYSIAISFAAAVRSCVFDSIHAIRINYRKLMP